MPVKLPIKQSKLTKEQIAFLEIFAKSCRRTILEMTTQAQSGHPGGSLSSLNFLSLLYALRISKTEEPVIISNGHIAPAVYAILAELGIISKSALIKGFRQPNSIFEGHVSRSVPGIFYGTGPLGTGISAATGFALAQKQTKKKQKVFATLGDGEMQEGQVYEMMNFAAKYALDNLIVFLDFNQVQLSNSLKNIMPIDPMKIFRAAGWHVLTSDGHDFQKLWNALKKAESKTKKPTVIIGKTIMGYGVSFMERSGRAHRSDWHGTAASKNQIDPILNQELALSKKEIQTLKTFQKQVTWKPQKVTASQKPSAAVVPKIGTPKLYSSEKPIDCRTAYGQTLLDLASKNKNILALTADLSPSVKTDLVQKKYPKQHIECGIAEQHMVSMAGGLSLCGYIPFVSTFGAFMTSRAKDQARVNDINQTNVKMVATHCGLSVGKDGPTHQAIDDMGSFLGFFNTKIFEPADANHTVHIIHSIASTVGNCYVRMGRHKLPILTKEDGTPFFDETYTYQYGKSDILRSGRDLTLCASGSMVAEAFEAWQSLKKSHPKLSIELVILSSPQVWDATILESIQKTKRILIVEDHTSKSGYASQLAKILIEEKMQIKSWESIGVEQYQNSGEADELYNAARISSTHIRKKILKMLYTPRKQKLLSFLLT